VSHLNRLVTGTGVHAKRRGHELEGSIDLLKDAGVEIIWNSVVSGLQADKKLTGVELTDVKTGEKRVLPAAGLLVADSFYLAPFLDSLPLPDEPAALDLGAGAGLPGIPLRLLWTKGSYTLIEKRQKRAMFLIQACGTLHLKKTDVHGAPAETYFAAHGPCDLIVSRAFMPWKDLLAFVEKALKPGGFIVFMMNDPLPDGVPAGWAAFSSKRYSVRGHERWLWALRRAEA